MIDECLMDLYGGVIPKGLAGWVIGGLVDSDRNDAKQEQQPASTGVGRTLLRSVI